MRVEEVIRDLSGLEDVTAAARQTKAVALDTEFLRERTYRARLCLVQLAVEERVYIVDPLAGLDMGRIADLVADPDIEVVVHAGRQDLELFYGEHGVIPQNVFDVQIAAGFAGLGASSSYGALVRAVLDVSLKKGESYSDWCRRPLRGEQLRYAADDVRYLFAVARSLKSSLTELGRLDWALEEMRELNSERMYKTDNDEVWRRVTGRTNLSGRQLAVLKEMARWREETASRRDVPRGWVMKDPSLIEIARRQPSSLKALGDVRGLGAREVEKAGREILRAVERGLSAPPPEISAAPPRDDQVRARLIGGLADVVVRTRAERAGIAPELVATRGEVEAVLIDVLSNGVLKPHRLLSGWRKELAGDAVIDLARGNLAIRTIDKPPYVEEVRL
ncbi:MAG: ribonuclease D [Actinomycetota bacterium]|nr:ribonuclease D [Actinomycetota bacterium]